jgi:RND family efflux transporter MFP subunit
MRPIRRRAITLAATLVAALMLAHCARHPAPAPTAGNRPALATATAETLALPRVQAFDGVLEAVNQATVSAQTSGRIVELPVDVDSTVRKGDVLARLRDAEPRARLAAAEAGLREAQAHATQAQAEYQRVKDVFDKKLIAQSQMDAAAAARDAALARLAQARAALDDAQEQSDYALVRAPYAGIVTARPVQVGELASPGRPLFTLLSLDQLRAVVDVPQQFIGELRNSGKARVTYPDGDSVEARAIHIFPYADEHSHTFRVRVDLPEAGGHAIYPGELVKVAFEGPAVDTLVVPAAAIAWRGEVSGVYRLDEQGHLQFRAVRVGHALADGRVAILSGLSTGETVATDPVAAANALRLQEGSSS